KIKNKLSEHYHFHQDASKDLAPFVTKEQLNPSKLSYESLDNSNIAAYSGTLLTHPILLLSCYNDDVALNVATSIAYEHKAASKQLVTIETNCDGTYTLKNLIEQLAGPKENSS